MPRPRKLLRRLLIISAVGAFSFAALLGILRLPAVQTALTKHFVNRQPGWKLEAETIDIGPGGVDARGIDFRMPGLTAKSEPLSVRVSTGALLRRELVVQQVDVNQLHIEVTPSELASSATNKNAQASAPFTGLLELLQAPLSWTVAKTNINARLGVRDAGKTLATGDLRVTGGGLSATTAGEFNYDLKAASAFLPAGPENVIRSVGTVRITQNKTNGIESLALTGDFHLPKYGAIELPAGTLELRLTATPGGERYDATIRFGPEAALVLTGSLDRKTHVAQIAADYTLQPAFLARIEPRLATLGAFSGHFSTSTDLAAATPFPKNTKLTLKSETTPFALTLNQNGANKSARLNITDLPIAWSNPWLVESGVSLGEKGTLKGNFAVSRNSDGELRLTTSNEVLIEPITFSIADKKLPPIPPFVIRLAPSFTLSPASRKAVVEIPSLLASTAAGDRVELQLKIAHSLADGSSQIHGKLNGALPSVFAGKTDEPPLLLSASWSAIVDPQSALIETLSFSARPPRAIDSGVAISSRQPVRIAFKNAKALPKIDPSQDLVDFSVKDLPLAWLSRWLPDVALDGSWARAASTLRYSADGKGFVFVTREPWSFSNLKLAVGGKELFAGSAQFSPAFGYGDSEKSAQLRELKLADVGGNRLEGAADFSWREAEKTFATTLDLEAKLPALPHSEGTFGALIATIHAHASTADGKVAQLDKLDVAVRNAGGPLFTVNAPEPVLFVQKPNGETVFKTLAALQIKTSPFPLAWALPWMPPGAEIAGTLDATDFLLFAEPQKFHLRPTKPFRVADFTYRAAGSTAAKLAAATLSFFPGADIQLLHQLRPAFQMAWNGSLYATDGKIDVFDRRAADFELALGLIGNDRQTLPHSIDLQARLDFLKLGFAVAGLPADGELVMRLNGGLLGGEPLDFWSRLERVTKPSPPGVGSGVGSSLPPLEFSATGRVDGVAKEVNFDVRIQHFTTPDAGDAAFKLKVALDRETLNVDSTLRSHFLDVGALSELAAAMNKDENGDGTSRSRGSNSLAAGKGKSRLHPDQQSSGLGSPALDRSKVERDLRARSPETAPGGRRPPSDQTTDSKDSAKSNFAGTRLGSPFWSLLRGHFDLDLGAVKWDAYRINDVRGRLDLTDRTLSLSGLTGTMFAGKWSGGARIDYEPRAEADHFLTGGFHIEQFETARVVQTVFPNEFGSFDARINLDSAVRSDGNNLWQLLNNAEGEFSIEGRNGVARITHPAAGTASTLLVLGGTLSFSPELRALGRLLRKFAEMPVDELRISGERNLAGQITLTEFRIDSPQARLIGRGTVLADDKVPLAGRQLNLGLELFARDETGVILGNMKLLEKRTTVDGYRRMTQPFSVVGVVGRPDPSPLYDLLAQAATGSRGTWGFIMRKVQQEVQKQRAAEAKKTAATESKLEAHP